MKIVLIHNAKFPVSLYGGTERVVWWLAKAFYEKKHQVILASRKESQCPFAECLEVDFSKPLDLQLPPADLWHFHHNPGADFESTQRVPFVATIHGNGKPGERFPCNSIFISRNHAERHGAEAFVYNGVDPSEYIFSEKKHARLLFLAKASWRVKNVAGALRIARAAGCGIDVAGGSRWQAPLAAWPYWRGVSWKGQCGGKAKAELLASARGLLFPVEWHEPFGLAVVEALVSGTPVIASRRGALSELVTEKVGRLGESEPELVEALQQISIFSSKECRDWALSKFSYHAMADGYLEFYQKVTNGLQLNQRLPENRTARETLLPLKRG